MLGVGSSAAKIPFINTFTKSIAATSDDITEQSSTIVTDPGSGSTQIFGDATIALYLIHTGFRFTSITIPKNAEIVEAYITINQARHPTLTTAPQGTWYAWAHDNAPAFSGGNIPSAVTKTSASAAWVAAASGSKAATQHTVTSIIQEIVNRSGWSSGNAINLFAIADVVNTAACDIWDDTQTTSPTVAVLTIRWR